MLNPEIQAQLYPRTPLRLQNVPWLCMLLILLISVLVMYAFYSSPTVLNKQDLGRLAVIAAVSQEESPLSVWASMEAYMGKDYQSFSGTDTGRAAKYLLNRIELKALKRDKGSAVRLDLTVHNE